MAKKMSREDFSCSEYAPLPGEVRCQHWAPRGACKLDTRFMCEEWVRLNPEAAKKMSAEQRKSEKKLDKQLNQAAKRREGRQDRGGGISNSDGGRASERASGGRSARNRGDLGAGDKHTRQLTGLGVSGVGQVDDGGGNGQRTERGSKVYDISKFLDEREGEVAPLIARPDLLTVEAIDELSARGMEVAFQAGEAEVTLVPDYTGVDRAELTYRDARTLVMVMQVFPGATLQSLKMPEKDEAS